MVPHGGEEHSHGGRDLLVLNFKFAPALGAHEVHGTLSGRKTMTHPTKGVLHLEHTSFQANDDPALKLVIYTPV